MSRGDNRNNGSGTGNGYGRYDGRDPEISRGYDDDIRYTGGYYEEEPETGRRSYYYDEDDRPAQRSSAYRSAGSSGTRRSADSRSYGTHSGRSTSGESAGRRTASGRGTARRSADGRVAAGSGGAAVRRKKKYRLTARTYVILAVFIVLLLFLMVSCVKGIAGGFGGPLDPLKKAIDKMELEPVEFNVLCVGDVMAHSPNIESANTGGGYDFTENYEFVTDAIQQADLALCNVETTFGGGNPRGYPTFNAPDELAGNLQSVGFDVALTSNNHMMDTGADGVQRTLEVLRNAGLQTVGSQLYGEDKKYLVTTVKGVKVGIVSYTYETTAQAGQTPSINGNTISDEAAGVINSFNYHDLDAEDYNKIQADIDGCRAEGAVLVICYMHWGEEYQQSPNQWQTAMAQELAERGADIIFASHPHVLQDAGVIQTSSGKKVPVFYSMGNFISNQRAETLSNRYTENGMMASVHVVYDPNTQKLSTDTMSILPTWVDKYSEGGSIEYRIIPLDGNLDNNAALSISGHLSRAQQALQDAQEKYGDILNGAAVDSLPVISAGGAQAAAGETAEEETADTEDNAAEEQTQTESESEEADDGTL